MTKNNFEPDPPAYTEGFLQQDYGRVLASLQDDPSQASLAFGNLQANQGTAIFATDIVATWHCFEIKNRPGEPGNRETGGHAPWWERSTKVTVP
jgi:hypothetical protein